MSILIPAVLPTSKLDLAEKLERLSSITAVEFVQIDTVDGRFAPTASWPYTEDAAGKAAFAAETEPFPHWGALQFEVDLMTLDAESAAAQWIAHGVSRLTVHVESTTRLAELIHDLKRRFGRAQDFVPDLLSLGLAIGLHTDLAVLEPYIEEIDYVQFMGIAHIGRQGQPFERSVLSRIESFRKRHPQMLIQVDGGVSRATVPALLSAGVDRLVVGSDLWNAPDLAARFREFEALTERYGTYE